MVGEQYPKAGLNLQSVDLPRNFFPHLKMVDYLANAKPKAVRKLSYTLKIKKKKQNLIAKT